MAVGKAPYFIRLSIDQIVIPRSSFGGWTNDSGFYPMSVPAVTKEALPILQFIHPIIVVPDKNKKQSDLSDKESYKLLSGRRTLQLLTEQLSRKSRIWAIRIDIEEGKWKSWEAMDRLSTLLLQRPDDATKALLAHKLHHDEGFASVARNFLDIATTQKIADLLGMSRASFNRASNEVKKHEAEKIESDITQKTTLGLIDPMNEWSENG